MMGVCWVLVFWLLWFGGVRANASSRPAVVNVGAFFSFDSTIGRVAKIAIEVAVKDVNSNSSVLKGTKLNVDIRNSNCSAFIGLAEALQFMGADVVAVIGPQSSAVAHNVLNFANELQMPFLSFAATDSTLSSPYQFPYFIRTTQSDLYQMTAVAEVVDYYGWREVIVIFLDDDYGRNGLSALDDALATRRCRISYKVRIPPGSVTQSDIMDILVKVALMDTRVIVLHAYPAIGFTVFSVARYLGMMEDGYVWIATDWLSSALDSAPPFQLGTMTDNMQGTLVLRHHIPDSKRRRSFTARWNDLTGGSLGLSTYGLYAYDTVWLLAHALDSFFNQGGVISFSNDSKLNSTQGSALHLEALSLFNGGPLLLKNILQSDFVGLTGAVKFSIDKSLINPAYDILNIIGTGLHRVGYWSNRSGLSAVAPELLYSMPSNHSRTTQLYSVLWPGESARTPRGWVFPNSGRMLRIGVPRRVGYLEFVSQVPGTNTSQGFCIDVFTAAVALLPYAVPYQFVPFGNGSDNPSYDELVNLITTGVFDGVVGDITIVTKRTKIVDFTQPFAASGLVVVAPVKKVNQGAWAFLRPFSLQMWGVTAAFFIFIGIVVWILEHRINNEFRGPPRQQFITIIWFSLSTLFFAHKEKTLSTLGRAVLIIWLFVVLIINSSYTASLTSILTVQQLYSPIKGIETLKEGDDLIGYQVGSFAERYLVEEIGISQSRLKALGSPQEYATELQKGPKNGGIVALVDERPYVEMFLASHCKYRIIGQEFTKSGWGFAFPRDSPLAIDLSTAILKLSENGDLQRIHDKWLITRACSSENNELDSDRLHLKSFQGLFLLCGIVCCIAFLIYLLQILYKFWQVKSGENLSTGTGSSRSRRLQTLISIIDEKEDLSRRDSKRRKVEKSLSENNREIQLEIERDSGNSSS